MKQVAIDLRIYPTSEQQVLINKTCGCVRWIYNYYLNERNEFYNNNIAGKELTKQEKSEIYKTFKYTTEKELKTDRPWLKEVSSVSLQQARRHLESAYSDFFKGKSKFPKFKSKKTNYGSYTENMMSPTCLDWDHRTIQIPKLGKVVFKSRGNPKYEIIKINSLTIKKKPSGKYFCSVQYETTEIMPVMKGSEIQATGLDWSPAHLYINDANESAPNYVPFKQKNGYKLKKLQRRMMKKQRTDGINSKNREKARIKVARLEEHIANCRKDYHNKESLRLVRENGIIGVETLNLKGIAKFLRNAKNVNDSSWSSFVSMIEWKANQYECYVNKADRYFPSSKLCSGCGWIKKDLKLKDREWVCENCGCLHQRDANSGINLRNLAILNTVGSTGIKACGEYLEVLGHWSNHTSVGSMKQEGKSAMNAKNGNGL